MHFLKDNQKVHTCLIHQTNKTYFTSRGKLTAHFCAMCTRKSQKLLQKQNKTKNKTKKKKNAQQNIDFPDKNNTELST